MFDYVRQFKGTNDVKQSDLSILRELDLLDNCAVVVMGITYNNFKNTKNEVSVEQNDAQIDNKTKKEYEKKMKEDLKKRYDLKRYFDKTTGGR